jgi:hypothetical protein
MFRTVQTDTPMIKRAQRRLEQASQPAGAHQAFAVGTTWREPGSGGAWGLARAGSRLGVSEHGPKVGCRG